MRMFVSGLFSVVGDRGRVDKCGSLYLRRQKDH